MKKLIIFVGIPGSGKSTMAEKLGIKSVSYDGIREEFFGKADIFYDEDFANRKIKRKHIDVSGKTEEELRKLKERICSNSVYATLNYRVKKALEDGEDIIIDATNVSKKKRIGLLNTFRGFYDSAEAYFFNIPFEVALSRNNSRDRVVPEKVIKDMLDRLEMPTEDEGFNVVHIVE